jgi:hypothetical protein
MAQAVSRRPLTAKSRVRAGLVHVGFVMDTVTMAQGSLRFLRLSLSITFHRSSTYTYYLGDKRPVGDRRSQNPSI